METQDSFSFEDKRKKCTQCGETKELSGFHANRTKCKSCKSLYDKQWWLDNKERLYERYKEYDQSPEGKYSIYKYRAKKKNFLFELDFETFKSLVTSDCEHCGSEGCGIDRLDSSQGYIISNCVPCCTMCNRMKLTHSEEDWTNQMMKIVEHKGLM